MIACSHELQCTTAATVPTTLHISPSSIPFFVQPQVLIMPEPLISWTLLRLSTFSVQPGTAKIFHVSPEAQRSTDTVALHFKWFLCCHWALNDRWGTYYGVSFQRNGQLACVILKTAHKIVNAAKMLHHTQRTKLHQLLMLWSNNYSAYHGKGLENPLNNSYISNDLCKELLTINHIRHHGTSFKSYFGMGDLGLTCDAHINESTK
jgi:hypothetical protein